MISVIRRFIRREHFVRRSVHQHVIKTETNVKKSRLRNFESNYVSRAAVAMITLQKRLDCRLFFSMEA